MTVERFGSIPELTEWLNQSNLDTSSLSLGENKEIRLTDEELNRYRIQLDEAQTLEEKINIIWYIIQEHKHTITEEARASTSSLRIDIENSWTLTQERLREILTEASRETPVSIDFLKIFLEQLPNIEKNKKPFLIGALLSVINRYWVGIKEIRNWQIKFNTPKETSWLQVANRDQTTAYQNTFNNYMRSWAFDMEDLQRALLYRTSWLNDFINENRDLNWNTLESSDLSIDTYFNRLLTKHWINLEARTDFNTTVINLSDEDYESLKWDVITNTTWYQTDREFIIGYLDDIRYNNRQNLDNNWVINYINSVDENLETINRELSSLTAEQLYALWARSWESSEDYRVRLASDPFWTFLEWFQNWGADLWVLLGIIWAIFNIGWKWRLMWFLWWFTGWSVIWSLWLEWWRAAFNILEWNSRNNLDSLRENELFINYRDVLRQLWRDRNWFSKEQFENAYLELLNKPLFLSWIWTDLEVFKRGDEEAINTYFNNLSIELNNSNRRLYELLFNGILNKRENDNIGTPSDRESIREFLLRTSRLDTSTQNNSTNVWVTTPWSTQESAQDDNIHTTPEWQEAQEWIHLPDLEIPSSTIDTYEEMVERWFELETPLEFIIINWNKRFLWRDNEWRFVYSPVFNENNIDSSGFNIEILQNPSINTRIEWINRLLQELSLRDDTFEAASNIRNDLRERFITFDNIEDAHSFLSEKYIEIFNIFDNKTRYSYNERINSLTLITSWNFSWNYDNIDLRSLMNNEINDFSEIETAINRLQSLSRRNRQEYNSANLSHLILSNWLDIWWENIDSELIMTLVEKIKSNDLEYIKNILWLSNQDIQKLREEINSIDTNWISIRDEVRDDARQYLVESWIPEEDITNDLINEFMSDAENSYKEQFYFSILSHIAIRKYISNNASSWFFRRWNYNWSNELVALYWDIEWVWNFNLSNRQRQIMWVIAKEAAILAITLPIWWALMSWTRFVVNWARAYRVAWWIRTANWARLGYIESVQRAYTARNSLLPLSTGWRIWLWTAEVVAWWTWFYLAREAIDSIWEYGNFDWFEYSLDENLKNIVLFWTLRTLQSLRYTLRNMPTIGWRNNPLHQYAWTSWWQEWALIGGWLITEWLAITWLNALMWEGDFTWQEITMWIWLALLFRTMIPWRDRSDMMRIFRKPDGSIWVRTWNNPRPNSPERWNSNPESYFRHSNWNIYYRSNWSYYTASGRAAPNLNPSNLSQINRTEYNRLLSEVRQNVSQRTREQMQTHRNPENLVSPAEKQAFIARYWQAWWTSFKNMFNNNINSIKNVYRSWTWYTPPAREGWFYNSLKQWAIWDIQRWWAVWWTKAIAISWALEWVDWWTSYFIEWREYSWLDSESLMNLLLFRYVWIWRAVIYKTTQETLQATWVVWDINLPIVDSVINWGTNMAWDAIFWD